MKKLFLVTSLIESGAGLALLAVPSFAMKLLFGSPMSTEAALVLGRLAGAALFALGVACLLARGDTSTKAARGLNIAMLFYNLAAVVILTSAGFSIRPAGILLWPAVVLHILMTGWCIACLRQRPHSRPIGTPRMTNT